MSTTVSVEHESKRKGWNPEKCSINQRKTQNKQTKKKERKKETRERDKYNMKSR